MVFNSIEFLIFFPIVIGIYYLLPKKATKYWLLFASYFFYMSWNATYAILIFISTLTSYVGGILLSKTDNTVKRKGIVAGTFTISLGILIFFKYFDFLINSINSVLRVANVSLINNPLDLLLPVGISFYTFQALGYIIDCYRKDIEAERKFVNFALFVSFFPQLVAGPIERSKNLLPQVEDLDSKKMFSYEKTVSGFTLMCWGMFMKVVLADHLAVFVDGVWHNLQMAGTVATVLATLAFSIQIYCDFAGYSAIAIGAARMMGFELMQNFNVPYFATSIAEFWRRWHISLSTWFKDYLYIPLGGNRCSKLKKYRNIMVTFLVSGLWHGADWSFVIWGGIHGIYQIIGDLIRPFRNRYFGKDAGLFSARLGKAIVTFLLTSFAWIFFKADSTKDANLFIKHMVTKPDLWSLFDGSLWKFGIDAVDVRIIVYALLVLIVVDVISLGKRKDIGNLLYGEKLWFRWFVLAVLIVSTIVFGAYGINFNSAQFIYFQF